MPTSLIDSAVFRDIFSTEAMRRVFSDENRVQKYLDFEAALARAQGRLGIIPKEAEEEIVKHCNVAEIDFQKLKVADREDRLSGAAGGAAARGTVPRRAWRVVPLGRDHAGHYRQRHRDADPRGAGADRSKPRADFRRARGPRQEISRHADGGPQQSATGGADHLRLQDGDAARRLRAPQAAPQRTARARSRRRIRRRGRHAVLAQRTGAGDASRADEGTEARPAGNRLAHRARHHCRSRLFPRPRHRHLWQDRLRREADDADRGGGAL